MQTKSATYLGIAYMALTWLLFACMSAVAKHTYQWAPPTVSFFFQNCVALVFTAIALLRSGPKALLSSRPKLLFLRAVGGTISFYCFFHSLSYLPLTDSSMLNNTAPLFVPLILLLGWRQTISWQIWLALLLGFAGVLLVFPPESNAINIGTLFGLCSGIGSALVMFVLRALSAEPPFRVLFYYFLTASLAMLPFAAPLIPTLPAESWPFYLLIGALFAIGQLVYTLSLRLACPSLSAPFSYSLVVGAALLDWIVWERAPSAVSFLGIVLVICGGATVLLQLRRKKVERTERDSNP